MTLLKHDRAAIRDRAAGDEVEKGGLPRAVRPDDCAQFTGIEIEGKVANRAEAGEGFVDAFSGEQKGALTHASAPFCTSGSEAIGSSSSLRRLSRAPRIRPGMLTMPPGKNRTTSMNMPPRKMSQ